MKETDKLNVGENISPEERARIDKILNEGFDPDEYEKELQKKETIHKEKPRKKQRFKTDIYTDFSLKILALAYNLAYDTNLSISGVVNDILKKFMEEHEEVKKKYERIIKA